MRKTMSKGAAILAMLVSTLFVLPSAAAQELTSSAPVSAVAEGESLKANLEIAHALHEIILLHIKKDQFDKVWPAAQALLALRFPPEQELATVKSVYLITEGLYEKGRTDLAHQILDAATRSLSDNANKSKVYLIQARLYKLEGQDEKAIEGYRKSVELKQRQ